MSKKCEHEMCYGCEICYEEIAEARALDKTTGFIDFNCAPIRVVEEYLDKQNTFLKNDLGKLQWDMMPEDALEEVMKVFQYGAQKYSKKNWIDKSEGVQYSRYMNALERHFKKFKRGQNTDEESKLYELAHVACNALMLLTYQLRNKGTDDRG